MIAVHRGRALMVGADAATAPATASSDRVPALALLAPDAATGADQYIYLGRTTVGPGVGTPLVAAIVGDDVAAAIEPDCRSLDGVARGRPAARQTPMPDCSPRSSR